MKICNFKDTIMGIDKSRIELHIELDKLKKRREALLDEMEGIKINEAALEDFFRGYSMICYRIECCEKRLAPKPLDRPCGKDSAHDFIIKGKTPGVRVNGKAV
jgi:hypothetical protein